MTNKEHYSKVREEYQKAHDELMKVDDGLKGSTFLSVNGIDYMKAYNNLLNKQAAFNSFIAYYQRKPNLDMNAEYNESDEYTSDDDLRDQYLGR